MKFYVYSETHRTEMFETKEEAERFANSLPGRQMIHIMYRFKPQGVVLHVSGSVSAADDPGEY